MWAQIVTHMLTAWHHHVYATLQILVGIVGGGLQTSAILLTLFSNVELNL